jgi:hypothetical protein
MSAASADVGAGDLTRSRYYCLYLLVAFLSSPEFDTTTVQQSRQPFFWTLHYIQSTERIGIGLTTT